MTDEPLCTVCCSPLVERRVISVRNGPHEGSRRPLLVASCLECGHAIREDARTADENLAAQSAYFDAVLSIPKTAHWPGRLALLARALDRRCTGTRLLDIGCGCGHWLSAVSRRWRRYGVEISPKAAEIARGHAGAEIFEGPIELYEPNDLFDVITCFAVIEHLSDPRGLLRWVRHHLRPGGHFVVMTGDRESKPARRLGPDWPLYEPEEHVSFFSCRSLTSLGEQEGFEIGHREWRFMGYQGICDGRLQRIIAKTRELAGAIDSSSAGDHLYVWMRQPDHSSATQVGRQ